MGNRLPYEQKDNDPWTDNREEKDKDETPPTPQPSKR